MSSVNKENVLVAISHSAAQEVCHLGANKTSDSQSKTWLKSRKEKSGVTAKRQREKCRNSV